MMKVILPKLLTNILVIAALMPVFAASAQTATPHYTWTGLWHFARTSSGDGVTALDVKIGKNMILPLNEDYEQAIYNVNNKFEGSAAWTTLAVGDLSKLIPKAVSLSPARQENYLSFLDKTNVKIFIEIFPFKGDDVSAAISSWLGKFKKHRCVAGVGIELEYFGKATDSLAKAWDHSAKSANSGYRLFLRHYDASFMPPTYRGKGDLIFVDDASEGARADLNKGFADWANHFAPTACAFQIGYPADEDAMDGTNATGWWKLNDPIKDWGNEILKGVTSSTQQLGLLWVTAKSGKTYHKTWDLTGGARVPAKSK